MGKGSIANLASAATVALSSLDMKIANPRKYLDMIDREEYATMLDIFLTKGEPFTVVEPSPVLVPPRAEEVRVAGVVKG